MDRTIRISEFAMKWLWNLSVIALTIVTGSSLSGFIRADDDKPTEKADSKAPGQTFEVEAHEGLAYYDGPDASKVRHSLDLFVPKDKKDFPVVLFIHGGAWKHGSKDDFFGLYGDFGKMCARHGCGAVVANYRLSPTIQHPEHVKDVARAFAWTHKNIAKYNGNPDQLFVCGHSAGGHLVALLATDDKYLKAEGLELSSIKGAIPMSGVYRIPDKSIFFDTAFGKEKEARKDASPLLHTRAGLPPFLIIYAENDLEYCGKETSEAFCKALKDVKCEACTLEGKKLNHISVIVNATRQEDPIGAACLRFIAEHAK